MPGVCIITFLWYLSFLATCMVNTANKNEHMFFVKQVFLGVGMHKLLYCFFGNVHDVESDTLP